VFFTGYERDTETDLDYAQARMYNKNHARFTTVDPALSSFIPDDPQSFARYSYTLNNPLKYTDPFGLYICKGNVDECKAFEEQRLDMEKRLETLDKKSKEYKILKRAINSYGKIGVDNGVIVQFGTNAEGKPANTVGGIRDNDDDLMKDVTATNPTGQYTIVTFDLAQLGGLKNLDAKAFGTALSHEGSHVADIADLVGQIPLIYADSSSNFTPDALKVLQSDMNSHYASEVLAYQVSIAATKALGFNKITLRTKENEVTIWESGWGSIDNKKTLQNIDKYLAIPKANGGYGLDRVNKGKLILY